MSESEWDGLFDPAGDKAWMEARRQRGRGAIFGASSFEDEDFGGGTGTEDEAGGEGGDDEGGGGSEGEDGPRFDHVRIPRLFGTTIRYVPIGMPEDAPITCLGKNGQTYFYLTPLGELISLADAEHGQAHITGAWAPKIGDLHRAFPQFDQQRRFKGFQAQYARDAMMTACALKGIFDAHEKVRGLGCWQDDEGHLVQHLGDRVLVSGKEHKPGELGGYVYPGRPPIPAPKAGGKADCLAVYQRMQMWNFARGEVDARLLLGQILAGVLGAAIEWRPMAFLTGDAGTGKSTLQKLVRDLLSKRMISTVDASEAALRALLGQDALAVSFDEIEADAQNEKAQAVMKLARTSASGDDAYRSGSDQVARGFTLRGSFLFSAIIPPSMRQQDMQRFAFLRLQTLPKGAKLPPLSKTELRDLGAGLVGRITEGWDRWDATLAAFFQGLQARGHEHRGAMQFGTMLAAAHIALEDGAPGEAEVDRWCDQLARDRLFEYENSEPAWLQAWRIIMTAHPEAWRGEGSPTVAEMVRRYLVASQATSGEEERAKAHDKLTRAGLAIVRQRGSGRIFLAVPPRHQGIAAIFKGTDFEKKGGEGAWNIPLRGAPRLEGDKGVLHVEKVPRLERQKCALFWLDGQAQVAGEWVRIFVRENREDEIDMDPADRVAAYRQALATAPGRPEIERVRDRAQDLRDQLDDDQVSALEAEFTERWLAFGD